ncbi:MAG: GIY-YIG nuclease family protein [Clostridia bacterium]
MAFLYMLECEDGTIYTGIAADMARRLKEHKERGKKCAKYTRSHPMKRLLALWETDTYAHAAKGEYAVKRLPRREKLRLTEDPSLLPVLCPALAEMAFHPEKKENFPRV